MMLINELFLHITLLCGHKQKCIFTFQLAIGKKNANKKTPRSGPDVADVINMEDSMTPDK